MVVSEPARQTALSVIRWPFAAAKSAVQLLISLPVLPHLSQERDRLQADLIRQQEELARLREALRQSQQAQLLEAAHPVAAGIVASVIGRSTVPTQQTILLDKGRRHGLTPDSLILDASGVIGRVIDLQPEACLVLLLTDPDSRVAGLIERSRETGLLVGRGSGMCELIYLDIQADIQEGDRLVTAGLGGNFPKGLLLGTVVQVTRDEQSWATRALVKPAANFSRLEDVMCLPRQP